MSASAGKKAETLRERGKVGGGTAAAGRVSAGVKPEADTGEGVAATGDDGAETAGGGLKPEVGTAEGLITRGDAGEEGKPGLKGTGVAAGAVGASPATTAAGDLACNDGKDAAAGGVDSLEGVDSVIDGVGTTPAGARGSCVLAGCPYTAGATATGLGCAYWSPSTEGSTVDGKLLLGAPALLLPAAAAAAAGAGADTGAWL